MQRGSTRGRESHRGSASPLQILSAALYPCMRLLIDVPVSGGDVVGHVGTVSREVSYEPIADFVAVLFLPTSYRCYGTAQRFQQASIGSRSLISCPISTPDGKLLYGCSAGASAGNSGPLLHAFGIALDVNYLISISARSAHSWYYFQNLAPRKHE